MSERDGTSPPHASGSIPIVDSEMKKKFAAQREKEEADMVLPAHIPPHIPPIASQPDLEAKQIEQLAKEEEDMVPPAHIPPHIPPIASQPELKAKQIEQRDKEDRHADGEYVPSEAIQKLEEKLQSRLEPIEMSPPFKTEAENIFKRVRHRCRNGNLEPVFLSFIEVHVGGYHLPKSGQKELRKKIVHKLAELCNVETACIMDRTGEPRSVTLFNGSVGIKGFQELVAKHGLPRKKVMEEQLVCVVVEELDRNSAARNYQEPIAIQPEKTDQQVIQCLPNANGGYDISAHRVLEWEGNWRDTPIAIPGADDRLTAAPGLNLVLQCEPCAMVQVKRFHFPRTFNVEDYLCCQQCLKCGQTLSNKLLEYLLFHECQFKVLHEEEEVDSGNWKEARGRRCCYMPNEKDKNQFSSGVLVCVRSLDMQPVPDRPATPRSLPMPLFLPAGRARKEAIPPEPEGQVIGHIGSAEGSNFLAIASAQGAGTVDGHPAAPPPASAVAPPTPKQPTALPSPPMPPADHTRKEAVPSGDIRILASCPEGYCGVFRYLAGLCNRAREGTLAVAFIKPGSAFDPNVDARWTIAWQGGIRQAFRDALDRNPRVDSFQMTFLCISGGQFCTAEQTWLTEEMLKDTEVLQTLADDVEPGKTINVQLISMQGCEAGSGSEKNFEVDLNAFCEIVDLEPSLLFEKCRVSSADILGKVQQLLLDEVA